MLQAEVGTLLYAQVQACKTDWVTKVGGTQCKVHIQLSTCANLVNQRGLQIVPGGTADQTPAYMTVPALANLAPMQRAAICDPHQLLPVQSVAQDAHKASTIL